MRLWTIAPSYLDTQGLLALWRESLLAQKVLRGKTKGYKHHPQLDRFKNHPAPLRAIATYLEYVRREACRRGYCFDQTKIGAGMTGIKIKTSRTEVKEEFAWLLTKLKQRRPTLYRRLKGTKRIKVNPLFRP
jgi:Pyrimidine dimer DNA glycosylase